MLVLERREGQRVCIGEDIVVEVFSANSGRVKLGVTAPEWVDIQREEVRVRERARGGGRRS